MKLLLATPPDFDFRSAVCSHGFFVLAPNRWASKTQSLRTIVTIDDDTAVPVVVSEKRDARGRDGIVLSSPARLGPSQRRAVRGAIWRMLRLGENLTAFHSLCRRSTTHQPAAEMRFGRLLRSPSLFEDVVKVICTCNTSWAQTVAMVQRITELWGVPTTDGATRGFPTPDRLARVSAATLRKGARIGYRAEFLHRLARDAADDPFELEAFERFDGSSDKLYEMLRFIHGVGDYAAAHLCMLLGHYDRLAVDTELKRFLRQRHPRKRFTPAALRAYYDRWRPYQILAYWFELWSDYTQRHGESHEWDPGTTGRRITTPKQRVHRRG
jgi:3-methyladenine DNA glycosylase/8-oxoguanine DNA glycosylase